MTQKRWLKLIPNWKGMYGFIIIKELKCHNKKTHNYIIRKMNNKYFNSETSKVLPSYKCLSCCKTKFMHCAWRTGIKCQAPQYSVFHQEIIAPTKLIKWPRRMIRPQITNRHLRHALLAHRTWSTNMQFIGIHPLWFHFPNSSVWFLRYQGEERKNIKVAFGFLKLNDIPIEPNRLTQLNILIFIMSFIIIHVKIKD